MVSCFGLLATDHVVNKIMLLILKTSLHRRAALMFLR